jgi:hypothetical protein
LEPVDDTRDFGAHGDFDQIAHSRSWHWWATKHRGALALTTGGVVGCLGARRALRR